MTILVDSPGVSFVSIDPGSTTGLVVWDSRTSSLYYDQIDMGTGRKAKIKVHGGHVESHARRDLIARLYGTVGMEAYWAKRGNGASGEAHITNNLESVGVSAVMDCILAAGPNVIVICEDFVLGWGDASRAGSSGREGLSPVRIQSRLNDRMDLGGVLNGDAWRDWDGHGVGGMDGRGIWTACDPPVDFKTRLADASAWRCGDTRRVPVGSRALWRGGGAKYVLQMPASRLWVGGSEVKCREKLKELGMWVPGERGIHAMDAMMHMMAVCSKMGLAVHKKPEQIWAGTAKIRQKGTLAIRR